MNQEQVWNKIATKWTEYRQKPISEVVDFLKDKKGKIIDMGCGSGRNLIKQEGIEYYGIDFSEKMLFFASEHCKKNNIKAKLMKSDLSKIPFDDEFFDAGLFISTLHCIEGEKARRKALEELFRVLKIGAEAMISVWNKEANGDLSKLDTKEGFVNWQKDGNNYQRYYYFYDKDELIYLLKEIGFEIIKTGIYGDEKHSKKNIVVYVRK